MLQCICKVRECATLLTGQDQSHQCPQVLLETPTAPTRSAPVEFPSPSGLHASTRQLGYPQQLRVATSVSDQAGLLQFKDHTCLRSVIVLLQTLSFNSKLQFQLRFFDNTTLGVFHHTQRHLHEPEQAGSQRELLTICRDRHHARHSDA